MGNRLIATALSLLVIVGLSVSLAQVPASLPSTAKALDPDVVALRLILGIGDATPQDWTGRASLDKGEVVDVEGLRFREGDLVAGRDSWTARSRLVRKGAAAKKATAKAKKQFRAKKNAGAIAKQEPAPKATGGPGTTGPMVTPNVSSQ